MDQVHHDWDHICIMEFLVEVGYEQGCNSEPRRDAALRFIVLFLRLAILILFVIDILQDEINENILSQCCAILERSNNIRDEILETCLE